jgi:hypothetical protein
MRFHKHPFNCVSQKYFKTQRRKEKSRYLLGLAVFFIIVKKIQPNGFFFTIFTVLILQTWQGCQE